MDSEDNNRKRPPQHREDEDALQDEAAAMKDPKISKTAEEVISGPHVIETPKIDNIMEPKAVEKESSNSDNTSDTARKGRAIISFGYLGEDFQGLQRQKDPNIKAIEPIIMDALVKAGAIDECNAHSYEKVGWDRCARTDKGVSAACNFVSLNIRWVPELVPKLNSLLPPVIRVWHHQRVGKGFFAHKRCDARRYQYLLPTKLLLPEGATFDHQFQSYVNSILARFVGSHRFHHYTQQIAATDNQAIRIILSFVCSDPFVVDGVEWVKLTVVGQSFLLNQIRKMVAHTICVVRAQKSPEHVDATFEKIAHPAIHMAPGEGLFLDECIFDVYNKNVSKPNEPIDVSPYKPKIEEFKESVLFPSIFKKEAQDMILCIPLTANLHSFTKWLAEISKFPRDWEQLLKEAAQVRLQEAEEAFQIARQKGYASVRGKKSPMELLAEEQNAASSENREESK